jgi:hypothetical protein
MSFSDWNGKEINDIIDLMHNNENSSKYILV